jgi:hypothetical protein
MVSMRVPGLHACGVTTIYMFLPRDDVPSSFCDCLDDVPSSVSLRRDAEGLPLSGGGRNIFYV